MSNRNRAISHGSYCLKGQPASNLVVVVLKTKHPLSPCTTSLVRLFQIPKS
jgi:hypothetical protein